MKVLVAGATGTVGLRAVQALVARGHEVTGISRTADGRRLLEDLGAEAVVADAMDAAFIASTVAEAGPEAVVDVLTAVPKGGAWRAEDMAPTNRLRTYGTRHLLDAAQKAGVRRYVAESSYLIYGSGDLGEEPLTEDRTPVHPHPWLLREAVDALATKERNVLDASGSGSIEGIVLRFGNLYGPGPAIAAMVSGLRRRQLPVQWPASGTTPWLHVDEAADAIVVAVERGQPGAVYNIVEDESISFAEFLRCLATTVGAPAPPVIPGQIMNLVAPYLKASQFDSRIRLSNRRARADLGWTPRFKSPREGLVEVAAAADLSSTAESTRPGESAGTVLVALSTNVVMVVAKAFAAALTGSPALFAETLHSLADTGNEVLLYVALHRARHPADLRHPYGYGSELFFWSLLAALSIFLTGGALSVWEGVQQLLHPGEATNFVIGYAVLGFGFVVDGTSWLRSLRQLAREARSRGVRLTQHIRSTTDTTVTAVYMEDGAALLGGMIAMVGLAAHQILTAHQVRGSSIPDALAAIGIGVLLASIALRLVRRNRDLLTNLSESPRVLDQIRDLLAAHPEVTRVGTVTTLYVGPHQLLVTADIQPVDELSGLRQRQLVTELCERVTEAVPRAVAVYLMPVVAATPQPALTAFDTDYWLRRYPDPEQS